ncbi:MAG: glycosyltransferase family 39 protein [Oligoflexia bacterium]|nr:glycosyltransferase family 39 protein [Oligoflexia bacterium]
MSTILAVIVLVLLTGLGTAPAPALLSGSALLAWASTVTIVILLIVFGALSGRNCKSSAEPDAPVTLDRTLQYPKRWCVPLGLWAAALGAQVAAPFQFAPFFLWTLSIVSAGVLALPAVKSSQLKMTWYESAALFAILAVAAYFRFWNLPALPFSFDGDVASVGLMSKDLLTGVDPDWLGVRWGSISVPCLRLWALGMSLFGVNLRGLAIGMATVGWLGTLAVWFLARSSSGRQAGIIAAFFCATNLAHIHFSRTLYIEPAAIVLCLEIGLLIAWLKAGRPELLLLSGWIGGIGLVVYDSARVGLILAPLLIVAKALTHEGRGRLTLAALGYFFAGVVLGWGPNLVIALSNLEDFVGRANSVTIFSADAQKHLMGAYETKSFFYMLAEQVRRSFLGAVYLQDTSPHAGFPLPQLEIMTRWLMLLGLGAAIMHARQPAKLALVMWIVLVNLLGGVLTLDPPYWPHLAAALPAYFLLAAQGAGLLLTGAPRGFRRHAVLGLLLAGLAWHTTATWKQYVQIASTRADGFSRSWRYLETLAPGSRAMLVGNDFSWDDRRYQFFAQHINGRSCGLADLNSITFYKDELLVMALGDADRVQQILLERGFASSKEIWSAPPAEGELVILKFGTHSTDLSNAQNNLIP